MVISHELKTPLVPIKGYTEMLKSENLGQINPTQKEALETLYSECVHLENLINDIMNAQKLEQKSMSYTKRKFDCKKFLQNIVKTHQFFIRGKCSLVCTVVPENLILFSDPEKLTEVFTNIIQNSSDFIPKDTGLIEIGAISKKDQVEFFICDNGIGIRQENLEKIFTKFFQVDMSVRRKYGGTGLGLSICKEIVEDMGGTIWAKSQFGKGTTFYITLSIK